MADTSITLAGKPYVVKEPVFKQLRQIVPLYNALSASDTDFNDTLAALLKLFFDDKTVLKATPDELMAFIKLIPTIAGLTQVKDSKSRTNPEQWGDTYAHLCITFGWDYDYVDNHMTLSRLHELTPYLNAHPPTHLLVAAYLGYEDTSSPDPVGRFFKSMLENARNGA